MALRAGVRTGWRPRAVVGGYPPGATLSHAAPLVRLGLHPRDARYPALLRHAQRQLERLLISREALTKAAFAARWRRAYSPMG